ncbi:AtpZ/AtpI family protein [Methylobacterium sp. E-041]|uniref:AtpZ/AtpI family protein n=1 Tax=unclassified Methylobacterium TaxID=2615210 RepID=UPI0011C9DA00|nr:MULTISPECIES: AtpZ/AtpI family protein [unclassified Methylobacterium]MCJ2037733.1 AtpZ/AtpI family protein [Methylobacterium sp. J-059]MCJ2075771.1 AtpZ/AtpI family protein [Methylobacterium sp. E-016]MCJ2105003.1 AtpZ/AtpI family protein [Methylobacterium sp. E-041]MCJ2111439.1 AtpZ/AtpI family protein [Methylobacterium sp. E-025]TXM92530.1 ATP F0F1 synthase subunit I [Methylobacterium sp. WL116]
MSGNDARDEGETGRPTPPDSELSARLRRLETQIERKRPPAPPAHSSRSGSSGSPSSLGQAMTLSTEFVAGVIAGGVLGWIFDRMLGTKPWGLIVLLMLGFVAGVFNVMRASGFAGARSGRDTPRDP